MTVQEISKSKQLNRVATNAKQIKYFSTFSGIGGFEKGIEQAWNAKNVTNLESSTKEGKSVKRVLENTKKIGELITQKKAGRIQECITNSDDKKSLIFMGEDVPVVKNQKNYSLPLNILDKMDIRTERSMEQDTCTNWQSKRMINQNTKSSAITAITQGGGMDSAPICVGYSEIDKYAISIYERHFPKHINFGNITKINTAELPDFDLLVGGFPCQSFSIAGKRLGFEDTRGTMFFELARILKDKRPRLFIFENVKGLLSHDNGQTFKTIISTITELGYDCQWQVLNSKNFGVPQNRERVFIVGHLRGTSRPKVFPLSGEYPEDTRTMGKEVSYALDANYHKGTNTLDKSRRQVVPVLTPDRLDKRQNGRRFKEDGEPSFTLTAQDKHGIYDGMKIRRLTPTECERLQGFPDGWTEGVSDTQRYKSLGNAVSVPVIQYLIGNLYALKRE